MNKKTTSKSTYPINLATSLALQTSAEQDVDYMKAIPGALEEACLRLGVDKKAFIKMFI